MGEYTCSEDSHVKVFGGKVSWYPVTGDAKFYHLVKVPFIENKKKQEGKCGKN